MLIDISLSISHRFRALRPRRARWAARAHRCVLVFVCCSLCGLGTKAQTKDSLAANLTENSYADSTKLVDSLRARQIKKTILRSTFVPGWGQVTNKQAWKLPAVAAAIGVPAYLFVYNLKQYKALKQAYIYRIDTIPANDALIPDEYKPLSDNSLRFYRDEFRKNVDLSALAFLIGWGLNVVDAAVFANLKDFDVTDKLSMRINPYVNPVGFSHVDLVFTLKQKKTPAFKAR